MKFLLRECANPEKESETMCLFRKQEKRQIRSTFSTAKVTDAFQNAIHIYSRVKRNHDKLAFKSAVSGNRTLSKLTDHCTVPIS